MNALRTLQNLVQAGRNLADALKIVAEIYEKENIIIEGYNPTQFGGDYIKLSDVKTSTTNGGSSIAGTQVRTLNTKDVDTGGHCTLASNQFTLAAGTYYIKILSSAYGVGRHKAFLYNVSDSSTDLLGHSFYADNANNVNNASIAQGPITIASAKTFELRQYTQIAVATYGLGIAANDGTDEIYSTVQGLKII